MGIQEASGPHIVFAGLTYWTLVASSRFNGAVGTGRLGGGAVDRSSDRSIVASVLLKRRDAGAKSIMVVASVLIMAGSALVGGTVSASAASGATVTPTITPDTGLMNGEPVTMTGSGFADTSPGNVLECNTDPNQPTVMDGGVINSTISVSCNAPSLSALVLTSATGMFHHVQRCSGNGWAALWSDSQRR